MKIALFMVLFVSAGYGSVSGNLRIAPVKSEVQVSDSSGKVCFDKEERVRLKIMSFNIRMGCGHDHPFRLERGGEGWLPQCAQVIRVDRLASAFYRQRSMTPVRMAAKAIPLRLRLRSLKKMAPRRNVITTEKRRMSEPTDIGTSGIARPWK